MISVCKKLQVLCVLMAVGALQIMGVQAGFFCVCTGGWSEEAYCVPLECHPRDHSEAQEESHACSRVAADLTTDHGHGDGDEHEHELILASLPITLTTSCHFSVAPEWMELPDLFQPSPDESVRRDLVSIMPWRRGDFDRGPPAGLVVARTMVRLV